MSRRQLILCLSLVAVIAAVLGTAWQVWRQQQRRAVMLAGVSPLPDLSRWPIGLATELQAASAAAGRTDQTTAPLARLAALYHANGFTTEARRALAALEQLEPANARWPYRRADLCQRLGDAAGAEAALRLAVKLDPSYAPGWLHWGNALTERGEYATAADCYARAVALAPGSLQMAFAQLAFEAFHGRPRDLRPELTALIQAHPEIKQLHELLAQMHTAAGDAAAAAREARRAEAVERRVGNEDPWLDALSADCFDSSRLGLVAYKLTREWRLAEAEVVLQRAIRIAPAETALRDSLCHVYELLGRLPDARAVLLAAVAECPDDPKMPLQLARVLRLEQRPEEAVLVLRRAVVRWPTQAILQAGLGVALRSAHQDAEAVPVLREALRLDSSLVEARYNLGYCLLVLGEKNAARAEVEQALLLRPDYTDALLFLSSLAIQAGDAAAAEPHVNRLYEMQPEDPETQILFAVLHLMKGTDAAQAGNSAKAESLYRAGLAAAPDFVPLLRAAGLLATRLGHWPEAVTTLERCVHLTPADPQAYLLLGNTLRRAGRLDDSRQILRQGLVVAQNAGDRAGAEEITRLLNQ